MIVRPSVIILEQNKLLLLKYKYGENLVFGLPGGNPDNGETLEQALIRELAEELNIDIKVENLAFIGEVLFPESNKSTLHCVFTGQIMNGIPKTNPEQTTALSSEWVPLEKLDAINMYPNIGSLIKRSGSLNLPTSYIGPIDQKWF